ncbi:MAG: amidinotransferase, partial [Methylobacterium sp.]
MDRESPITAAEAVDESARVDGYSTHSREPSTPAPHSPVMAWNEWDPLEEVIVGSLDGATIPTHHLTVIFNLPRAAQPFYRLASGWKYPKFMKKLAQAELDNFITILAGEGVKVRRPDAVDFSRKFKA